MGDGTSRQALKFCKGERFVKTPYLFYTYIMSIQQLLRQIRPAWLHRVSHAMTRGESVRESFQEQLNRFYDLLEHAVVTGDPSWMDTIILDWASAPTQTDLDEKQYNVSALLKKIITLTTEIAREMLSESDALDMLVALMPVYAYILEKAARLEVEARVAYISNQLNEMREKLERLDRSKSNFIAVAAHELKTPLTLIEGYTSMMRDLATSPPGESLDPLLQGIDTGIRRLREIVDDMIDVSLIDNNLLSLNFQPVWLSHLLGLLRSELSESLEARQQTLEIRPFPGSEQLIFADPERLYQALRNILTNAIKYTPDGGRITVDGRTLPGFIEVTITDTGIGIAPEDQPLIFEKFGNLGEVSLHSSGKTKFKGGGPGLGLAIARGIIEAHGGTIWVESEGYDEEKCPGSTFHLLIPARSEPSDSRIAKLFGSETELSSET
ncbi:MAG: sensor histidine kinase [Anaerolineae bacterium]|nr:MAG: sensor histidine kinase [Anaerolineae bacterium]